jgi:hypothetical protein
MKNLRIEIKWAILFFLMSIAWMILEKIAGLHDKHIDKHATVSLFFIIPAVFVYYLAFREKREKFYGGFMTYKQGATTGMWITIFFTILSPLSQYITTTFITPEYFPNAISYAVRTGKMTQMEAERYFSLNQYIVQGLIGAPIMGSITSIILAIFMRKKSKN